MTQGEKKSIGRIALQQRAKDSSAAAARDKEGHPAELQGLKALSEKFGVPAIDLRQVCIRLSDLELIPVEIARRHVILPVLVRDDRLFIAMANPSEQKVIDELEFVTDKKVFPYVTAESALAEAIESAYAMRSRDEAYFIGSDCPADVVQKAMGRSQPPPSEEPFPPAPDPEPLAQPNVVLGDAMGRVAKTSEFPDTELEDLSAEEHSVVTSVPGEAEPVARPGAKTILVVDDEPDIRGMIERLLKGKGYRVVGSDNGRAALALVKKHAPDLIILDAMLPEVHGFDIARRIKASKRYAHIPIIMVSAVYRGWRFAADLRESCGVEHYIEKPFKIAEVLQAVEASFEAEPDPESSKVREMSAEAEQQLHAGVAAYQAGHIDEAVVHLKRGIAVDPLAFRLHFQLGLIYGKKGQLYDAIGELERAVEINSRHFPAVRNLAILYQKAGLRNKATEMWERALNVAPDDVTRQSIRQHLLSLL
jgi:DNA-binding response OmpR family regulator